MKLCHAGRKHSTDVALVPQEEEIAAYSMDGHRDAYCVQAVWQRSPVDLPVELNEAKQFDEHGGMGADLEEQVLEVGFRPGTQCPLCAPIYFVNART